MTFMTLNGHRNYFLFISDLQQTTAAFRCVMQSKLKFEQCVYQ